MSIHLQTNSIDTPIGRLRFYPKWTGGEINATLLLQSVVGHCPEYLPPGMEVTECIAVWLQFSVISDVSEFAFCCDAELLNVPGGACSGEELDAWEWIRENHIVIVGTEAGECLNPRLQLPLSMADDYPITLVENNMQIQLKNLSAGQSYALHFMDAWNTFPEPHDCSCWYAVNVSHEACNELLANARLNTNMKTAPL